MATTTASSSRKRAAARAAKRASRLTPAAREAAAEIRQVQAALFSDLHGRLRGHDPELFVLVVNNPDFPRSDSPVHPDVLIDGLTLLKLSA
mgnify:CR=1 FL=1